MPAPKAYGLWNVPSFRLTIVSSAAKSSVSTGVRGDMAIATAGIAVCITLLLIP
jgi:hypothetical protein